MQVILQILGSVIQVIGAMGIVFISLPSIYALIFHGRKTSLFSIGFIITGTLISVIFMYLGNVITKNAGQKNLTHPKKKIVDIFIILGTMGILGILAGTLFHTSHPVGTYAYRSRCKMNMRQIGFALENYSYDHRKPTRKFFSSEEYQSYPDESGDRGLKQLVKEGYLRNTDLLKCPKDKREKKTFWGKTFGGSSKQENSEFKSDYIYLGGYHDEEDPALPILFDKIGNHKDYCNVIFSDGQPKSYELEYKTYEDLIEWINKEKNYSKENFEKIKESLKQALENNKGDI